MADILDAVNIKTVSEAAGIIGDVAAVAVDPVGTVAEVAGDLILDEGETHEE